MTADSTKPTIVFVYNADQGALNALIDSVHKLVSPSNYNCRLCAVTHTPLGERKQWREFVESLDHPTKFLHRDQLETTSALAEMDLPAILLEPTDGALELWIDADAINQCDSLESLEALIRGRMAIMP